MHISKSHQLFFQVSLHAGARLSHDKWWCDSRDFCF